MFVLSHRKKLTGLPGDCGDGDQDDACKIYLFRYTRVHRCDGSDFDTLCDDNNDCTGDCMLDEPSWDLDSGFPVEVHDDLQAEAADMTVDKDGRVWVVNTENDEVNDRGTVVLRYTDTGCDCSASPAADCDFGEFDEIELTDGNGAAAYLANEYDTTGGQDPGHCNVHTSERCVVDADCEPTPSGPCSTCDAGEYCNIWDDIASISHDGAGNLLQVVWSNQATDTWVYAENDLVFGVRHCSTTTTTQCLVNDDCPMGETCTTVGTGPTYWSTPEVAYNAKADDHIWVGPHVENGTGATQKVQYSWVGLVKTSNDDFGANGTTLTKLLVRSPPDNRTTCSSGWCTGGYGNKKCSTDDDCDPTWYTHEITTVPADHTRPVLAFDRTNGCAYYFAHDRDASYSIVEQHATATVALLLSGPDSQCTAADEPWDCCTDEE